MFSGTRAKAQRTTYGLIHKLAGFGFGLGLVQKGDLLVFKITKQQRGFELGHET
jgi:hypothetical protein